MLGIIGAEVEEIRQFKNRMIITKEESVGSFTFYVGKYNKKDVTLVRSGMGKSASSMVATLLISKYGVDSVINIGSCGGLTSDINVLDILVPDYASYNDVDVREFGHPYGEMSECPRIFNFDKAMKEKMIEALKKSNMTPREGNIISGDSFITDKNKMLAIVNEHFSSDNVVGVDMESASIAQTCYFLHVPCLVLRIISDKVGTEKQAMTFEEMTRKASYQLADALQEYCSEE